MPRTLMVLAAAALVASCKSEASIAPTDTTNNGGGGKPTISLVTTAPYALRIVVQNNNLFWVDSSETPLNQIALATGARTVLVSKVPTPERAVSDGNYVFWVAADRLYRTSIDGATTTLLDHGERAGYWVTAAIGMDADNVYWANTVQSPSCSPACNYTVRRVPKLGGPATTIIATHQPIVDLVVRNGDLFWEGEDYDTLQPDGTGGSAINMTSLADGHTTVLVNGLLNGMIAPPSPTFNPASWHPAGGIEVDDAAVYFATQDFSRKLLAVPLDGGPLVTLVNDVAADGHFVRDMALDDANVYFVDDHSINSVPKAGGTVTQLASATSPVSVARLGTSVYWLETVCCAHRQKGVIRRVATTGGPIGVIRADIDAPVNISVDAGHLYWVAGGLTGQTEGFGSITSSGLDGTNEKVLAEAGGGGPFATDGNYVYFGNGFTLKRVPAGGGKVERLAIGDQNIVDVAVDEAYVYWAEEIGPGVVRRMPLGGGAFSNLASFSGPGAFIRLDATHVYWRDTLNTIWRVAKGGGAAQNVLPSTHGTLTDFVVSDGTVYYAQWDSGGIGKVPVTGGTPRLLTGARPDQTRRLATDGKMLYWIDQGSVSKIPVGGGDVTFIASVGTVSDPFVAGSLALDDASVYWTEYLSGAIRKATPR